MNANVCELTGTAHLTIRIGRDEVCEIEREIRTWLLLLPKVRHMKDDVGGCCA